MQDSPSAALLVEEVRNALLASIAPGFPQKVAANALGIAARELTDGQMFAAAEMERLGALVGDEGDLATRNTRLACSIRDGALDAGTPGLVEHLIRTTVEKVEVDQPSYPAFRQWKDGR